MHFSVITLFPEMFDALKTGITGRAMDKDLLDVDCINPRNFADNAHGFIDDRPYGGGPGMVMMAEPLSKAIEHVKASRDGDCPVYALSPQGTPLTQDALMHLSQQSQMVLIAGRYEGIDERVIERHVDAQWSIGDYVLTGGELPAMVMIDGITRLLPDVLGDERSAQEDSFATGIFDHPHYTRPRHCLEADVPEVLLGGDHQAITRWRRQQALGRTFELRPDLLAKIDLTEADIDLLNEYLRKL
jgi:tRNA (guanine37-N1)-methyltransferase